MADPKPEDPKKPDPWKPKPFPIKRRWLPVPTGPMFFYDPPMTDISRGPRLTLDSM